MRWDKDFNLIGTKAQAKSRTYLELKAINSPLAASLPHDDNKDFSPRLGFAWDMSGNGKHVFRGGYGLYFGQTFLNIPLFMIQQQNPTIFVSTFSISSEDPCTPTNSAGCVPGTNIALANWRFGVDPFPVIPPPPTQLPAGSTGRLMDPHYKNPYTQQWNIGYAHQLNSYSVLEVDYVHVLALRESKTLNVNPIRTFLLDASGNEITTRPLSANFAAAGVPVLGRIDDETSVGRSRYDGLNISYRRRLHNHFTVNATYTLSRALAYNGNAAAFRNRASDHFDYFGAWELGPVPNDSRHRFSMGSVIDLPGGFQVAPVMQLESARAYNSFYDSDVLGQGGGRGNTHAVVFKNNPSDLKATLVAFGNPGDPTNGSANRRKFRDCLRSGQCEFAAFDNLRGQPFFQLDARVTKNFRIGERHNIAAFIQFFDLTNRANFGNNFNGNIRQSNFKEPIAFITPSGVTLPHAFAAEIGARWTF